MIYGDRINQRQMTDGMKAGAVKDITPRRVRRGRAIRSRGRERVKHILKVSRNLFTTKGLSQFSMRNIAAESGISLGNLSYYFKSKNDLFRSMVDDVTEEHKADFQKCLENAPDTPDGRLYALVDELIRTAVDTEYRQFFYQIWAISAHDPFVAECREEMYVEFFKLCKTVCAEVNPGLTATELDNRIYILMATAEGLNVILGNQKRRPSSLKKFDKEVRKQIHALMSAK